MPVTNLDVAPYDPGELIQLLWNRVLETHKRLDAHTAGAQVATDPVERLELALKFEAAALLLCAIPAPNRRAMEAKELVALWLDDQNTGAATWSSRMARAAMAQDRVI